MLQENVLPTRASAVFNVRILPGESLVSVVGHFQKVLRGTGASVEVADDQRNEPLPESPASGPAWDAVVAALAEAEPDAVPLPYLVMASTDTKHYQQVAASIYRVMAVVLGPQEIDLIHSPNERISIENVGRCLQFYRRLIRS